MNGCDEQMKRVANQAEEHDGILRDVMNKK
jgi:hypothetical protein